MTDALSILRETIKRFDGTDNGYCRLCRRHRLCDTKGNAQPCENDRCFSRQMSRAVTDIESMRQWIRDEGARSDTCTFGILGEVCAGCRCGKATGASQ